MTSQVAEHGEDAALAFFVEVVEPTVAEFLADAADRRRGCLACLVLSSMTEHFFHARPDVAAEYRSASAFKRLVRSENGAIGWIADVANATKHVERAKREVGFTDLRVTQLNLVGIARAGWPLGGHEVLVGQNSEWRLRDLVDAAMVFWREKLAIKLPGSRQSTS